MRLIRSGSFSSARPIATNSKPSSIARSIDGPVGDAAEQDQRHIHGRPELAGVIEEDTPGR